MAATQTIHLDRYSPDARAIVAAAQQLADERQHAEVEPIHLLYRAVDRDRGVAEVFKKAGCEPADVVAEAETQLRRLPKNGKGEAYLSQAFIDLLARAEREAEKDKLPAVQMENLLNALSQEIRGGAGAVLQALALGPGALRPHLAALHSVPRGTPPVGSPAPTATDLVARSTIDLVELAKKGDFDPVIGRDLEVRRVLQILARRAKNHPLLVGEAGVGKTAVVRALAQRIAAGDVPRNLSGARILQLDLGGVIAGAKLRGEIEERLRVVLNAIRTGEPGKGETILFVEDLAALFGGGPGPGGVGELLKPTLVKGDLRILATVSTDGLRKIQEKDAAVLRRLTVIDIEAPDVEKSKSIVRGVATRYEKHHGVRIGEGAIASAVVLAKRYVQDRSLPDSALDLLDEAAARKRVELDGVPADVDDRLRRLDGLEAQMTALANDDDRLSQQTFARLEAEAKALRPEVESLRQKLVSRRGAVAAAETLRSEFRAKEAELEEAKKKNDFARLGELEHVTLPDLKRRLAAAEEAVSREGGSASQSNVVDENDVAKILEDWTGIPASKMLEGEADKLLKMEERLAARVVGQDEAVRAVAKAVRRGRVGLRDPGKPIGSFLFLGPSGVGKTELAKALAEFLFDDELSLTRLDMSEFMEKHMAQRLVGAPPGYVDSEEGGFLTEAVRRRPYSVLLFDEVEKAHGDVFNLLLQVLDDGRLTDGRGRLADFSNTVVIMTSNIGSQRILEADQKLFESVDGREALKDVLREELKAFFRPEFLNRIDDTVVFRALDKKDLDGIARIQLRKLDKLLVDKELKVQLTDAARARLVDIGYEPGFGARPLRRAILKEIQDPLAEEILKGGYAPGTIIQVDVKDEEFTFSKA
ncbi:MAG: AAA family ATPase [Myxococcales bacterium]|nr:AAA family ATPase [Myxococcales bacterium]